MCTVAELITKLQTLPPNAIVEVKRDYVVGWDVMVEFAPVDLEETAVHDFTTPDYKDHPRVGGKILVLISSD